MDSSTENTGLDVDLLAGGAVRYDLDGWIVAAKGPWEQIIGWTAGQLAGRSSYDMLHPDDIATVEAAIGRVKAGVRSVGLVVRWRHRDGSWVALSWTNIVAPDGLWAHAIPAAASFVAPTGQHDGDVVDAASSRRPAMDIDAVNGENMCSRCETYAAELAELRAIVAGMAAGLIAAAQPASAEPTQDS